MTKKLKYLLSITKVRSWNGREGVSGQSLLPFNQYIESEIWFILSPLAYQVLYALLSLLHGEYYGSWHGLQETPPLIKLEVGTVIMDQ